MALSDPYYGVQSDVQANLNEATALFERWKECAGGDGDDAEFEYVKGKLEPVLGELDEGVRALEGTVNMVERKAAMRTKFGIDEQELLQRKRFVSDVKGKVSTIRSATSNPALSTRAPRARAALVGDAGRGGNGDRYAKLDDSRERDNDDFIGGEQQRQQQLMREQDRDLEQLGAGVMRIHGIAREINVELGEQNRLIQDIEEHADGFEGRLGRVQAKLERMLRNKDRGKICAIVVLMIVLAVVAGFAFSVSMGVTAEGRAVQPSAAGAGAEAAGASATTE